LGSSFFVLYDDEHIGSGLLPVLPAYINSEYEVAIAFRLGADYGISHAPRLFKAGVRFSGTDLTPMQPESLSFCQMLDGWVYSHGFA